MHFFNNRSELIRNQLKADRCNRYEGAQTFPSYLEAKSNGAIPVAADESSLASLLEEHPMIEKPTEEDEVTVLDEAPEVPYEDLEIAELALKLGAIKVSAFCNTGNRIYTDPGPFLEDGGGKMVCLLNALVEYLGGRKLGG